MSYYFYCNVMLEPPLGLNASRVCVPTLKLCSKYQTWTILAKLLGWKCEAMLVVGQSFILVAFSVEAILVSDHVIVCCPIVENDNSRTCPSKNFDVSTL